MEFLMHDTDYLVDEQDQRAIEEYEQAQQEAYYWHVIAEFYGMVKTFGVKKVMEDYNAFKTTVEVAKEETRIQLVS